MKTLTPLMWIPLFVACASEPGGDALPASPSGEQAGTPVGGKADTTVGPVTSMQCQALSHHVRPGGFVEIDVQAKDRAGASSRNYELSVQPEFNSRVVQRNKVIFNTPGAYEITCCALDTGLCDTTAVQVGQLYPALSVTAPRWAEGTSTVQLTGQAFDHMGEQVKLTVDDREVRVDADNRFTVSVPVTSGVNTFTLVATDAEGRSSTRYAWTLAGPFGDLDDPEDDGVVVALGSTAYPQLSDLIERGLRPALRSESFYAAVMRPQAGEEGFYQWKLNPEGIGISDVDVDLRPNAVGLKIDVILERIIFTAEAQTKLGFFGWKRRDVTATVDRFEVSTTARLRNRSLSLDALTVNLVDFDIEISDLPGFIEDILLYFFEDDLKKTIEEELREQLDEKLEGALDGFARELDVDMPEPLHGALTVRTDLSTLHGDQSGLLVGMAFTVDGETDPLRLDAPGPWRGAAAAARPFRQGMYEAAMSIDLFNTLFFAAWQTGALDMSFNQEEQRPDPDVPEVLAVDYFVDLKLPPVVQPGDNAGEYFLDLAAIQLDAVLESSIGFINASAAVGGRLSFTFKVEDNAVALDIQPVYIDLDLQVAPADLERESVRRYFARLIQEKVFPKIARLSKAMPVPEADLSKLGLEGINTLSVKELRIAPGRTADVIRLDGRVVVE
ncbi:MAG: hypothetical protein ACE366_19585 [Bradymonadia bacterium]